MKEHPELWTDKLKYEIYCAAERVELEEKFIDICFEKASIPDLEKEDVKEYIRYIAGRRLLGLGMKNIFHVKHNPLPWIDMQLNAVEHTNFLKTVLPSMLRLVHKEIGRIYSNERRRTTTITIDGVEMRSQT